METFWYQLTQVRLEMTVKQALIHLKSANSAEADESLTTPVNRDREIDTNQKYS